MEDTTAAAAATTTTRLVDRSRFMLMYFEMANWLWLMKRRFYLSFLATSSKYTLNSKMHDGLFS